MFDELEPGSYTVVMVSAPSPYVIEEGQSIDARVVAGAESPVNVKLAKNAETTEPGSIKVTFTYVDGDTETPVAGAVAKVGETEKTSDENGQAVFDELEPGSYTVTIVSVPDPYTMGEDGLTAEVSVVAGSETPLAVHPAKKSETTETGKIVVTVVNSETNDPVEGVAIVIKTSDPDDEGTEYVTLEDGKATAIKDPGSYTIVVNSVPAGYKEIEYSKDVTVESGVQLDETIKLDPAEVEPEDLAIVEFTGLAFDPEEQTVVPTTSYTASLDGYALTLNQKDAIADQVKFMIEPTTTDIAINAKFDGTASGFRVIAIDDKGIAVTMASASAEEGETCEVAFNSADFPYVDPETGEIDPEKEGGTLPENTKYLWVYVYNPSKDFAVNEFTLTGPTEKDFTQITFKATTEVRVAGLDPVKEVNTGVVKKGDPQATLTITGSAAKLNTGDSINYTVNFENVSQIEYQTVKLDICVDSKLAPESLKPGTWTGYTGNIDVISVGADGTEKLLHTIDASSTGAIMLTDTSIKAIRFVTKAPTAGSINIENIVLTGSFAAAGTAKTHAEFAGTIAEDLVWNMNSDEISTEIVEEIVPPTTGTISITVTDPEGNPVKDVIFKVEPSDAGADSVPATMKTNENGVATMECDIGKYKVTLAGGIPEEFDADEFSKEIEVTGGAVKTEAISLKNKPVTKGVIEIKALLDGTEDTPVPGVVFALYRKVEGAESVKIGTGRTQDNGILTDTLEAGTYFLQATGVPEGYEELTYEKELDIVAGETTKETVFVKQAAPATPTPTPDPGNDPNPPGPGGNGGSTETPTPTPEPEMLYLDSPKITSNASSIAYGSDALFYIRGLNTRGMEETDYYVLHLMIPSAIQVKTLTFPGFGTDVRVTLTYESGTSELGTYAGGETVNLTDRQGTNLRYIAFQIHGVDSVTATGDIQLLVKNISARDRIVTLQAILSVRDSKTKVISDALNKRGEITPKRTNITEGFTAQKSDRYNVSIAGPKNGTSSGTTTSSSTPGTTSTGENTKPEISAAERVKTCYPQLICDSLSPDGKKAPEILTVEKRDNTKPLLIGDKVEMPTVKDIDTTQIVDQPVTNELIAGKVKQKAAAMLRLFTVLNRLNPASIIK